ncbi:MAG: CBS domain-containing protein [Desulfovibrio sp.]|uniref:CBS and ACT domain-containing protein n=1 Tax=Desulfovibrio sp. TaxID=885 RepID=UPI001A728794|nr:CBS and ACT domain-containing protein [Desulfovibrio sp.]MBD5416231.1 CBS domain-containing protein [Desulfovibrio sp.]MDE6735143.1 CBS and ACT domain-containing protein [Desulfovibrio sp.]
MLIRNWMTPEVITVTPDTSLLKLGKLMRDHGVRRLPVLDNGRVVGIISDRDVRDASPSKATTLDMYEMHYLLAEIKAKDIMTPKPVTIKPTDTVEKAAMIMLDRKIGGLPVVDEKGELVGIISDQDVFKALVNITGVRDGGIQLGMEIANEAGAMRPIFDLLRKHGARILSVLSTNNQEGQRNIFLRIRDLPDDAREALLRDVQEHARLLYWARDEVHLA